MRRGTRQTRARRRPALRIAVGALVLGAVTAAVLVATAAAASAPPKTTSPPTIEGTFQIDQTVTATTGSWANSPTSFAYQWQRCDRDGNGCADISKATEKTYTLTGDDVAHTVRVLVTASNSDGKSTANSHPGPIVSGSEAPRNTKRPALSGTAKVGESLTVSKGSWTGGVRTTTYQWQRCDKNGNNCADVKGATAATYGIRSADKGKTLRAEVTAQNVAGKTTVTSDRSDAVAAAGGTPQAGSGCDNSRAVAAANLQLPVRLMIDRFTFTPNVVQLSTREFTARIHVADTCGRAVSGANLWAVAIPYRQTTTARGVTAGDGWATLQFTMLSGFPANPGRQQILAVLIRATKPDGSVLAGVSTRRTVRQNVSLH
jgi:hypothetical protein